MEINSQFEYRGKTYKSHWVESDPNMNLDNVVLHGVHAVCFCGDKMVVVFDPKKNEWTPPGGGIESGETWQEATIREVKEESNMKVLYIECIGYQDAWDAKTGDSKKLGREARPFCIVKPYGEFVSDPDDDIGEIKLIDPKDYKKYFDWGEVGDRMMQRAVEIKDYDFEDVTKETVVDPIELAKKFASKKFAEIQTGNHFLEVYEILKEEFGVNDQEVLIAGLLHDTLEDTSATYEQIERIFGKRVADMVLEVSHPKDYKGEQVKEYYEKLKHISDGGKMIKLADFKSHLPKFIGAFTGENNLPKFIHTEYTDHILDFLESCFESQAKNTVYDLAKKFEGYILGHDNK